MKGTFHLPKVPLRATLTSFRKSGFANIGDIPEVRSKRGLIRTAWLKVNRERSFDGPMERVTHLGTHLYPPLRKCPGH